MNQAVLQAAGFGFGGNSHGFKTNARKTVEATQQWRDMGELKKLEDPSHAAELWIKDQVVRT